MEAKMKAQSAGLAEAFVWTNFDNVESMRLHISKTSVRQLIRKPNNLNIHFALFQHNM